MPSTGKYGYEQTEQCIPFTDYKQNWGNFAVKARHDLFNLQLSLGQDSDVEFRGVIFVYFEKHMPLTSW